MQLNRISFRNLKLSLMLLFVLLFFLLRSVAYLPPEILTKRPHSRTVDWYLLGTFLFELLVGIPPYYDNKKDVKTFFHSYYSSIILSFLTHLILFQRSFSRT